MHTSSDPGRANFLYGVAAISPRDAWAVGSWSTNGGGIYRTLIERWNGKAWKVQKSPNPRGSSNSNSLSGVAATSRRDAWAVGVHYAGTVDRTLIERWNGKAWKVQKSPNPGGSSKYNDLNGVAATSPTNAWAVGDSFNRATVRTVVEHWDGKAWRVQKSAELHGGLFDVAAVSASDAWAVGVIAGRTLIERWDGKAWRVQRSPSPGGSLGFAFLRGVAATSPTNAWAVGYYHNGTTYRTLVEHWDGKAWNVQTSPDPRGSGMLYGVAAISPRDAWAVGDYATGSALGTLIEHWNGKAWRVQKSPNPGGSGHANELYSVAAISPSDAWAAGFYTNPLDRTLVERYG